MNEEQAHAERVRKAIIEEESNTVCQYLQVKNRILYCEIDYLNTGKTRSAKCMLDPQSSAYVSKEFCDLTNDK